MMVSSRSSKIRFGEEICSSRRSNSSTLDVSLLLRISLISLCLFHGAYGHICEPAIFMVVVDPASDADPVSVTFTRNPMEGGNISDIEITNNTMPINHTPVNMTTVANLPSCFNLMATLVYTNTSGMNVTVSCNFTTMDDAPTSLTVSEGPQEVVTGTSVVLDCTWDPPVYYVAWYKDGVLISSEDLASGTTLMSPSVGVVSSSFDDRMSILTIMNSNFNDSGNYTCAVSCGARNVEFSMINSNLASSIIVAVFEQPQVPGGFEGRVLKDGSSPTVSFEWMLLNANEDGIPPEGSKGLQYIVTVKDGGSVVGTSTVDDPMNSTVFTGLQLCNDLTGILVATNGLLTSVETNTTVQLTESTTPMPNVTSEDNETCVSSPANVTLQCSWSSPSYYVAWYKDGSPIYSEDLSVPDVTMEASVGFVVESNYISRTSTLTILSSSIDDSGNYTCAVSCGARNVSFDAIPPEVTDYIVVSVYDVPEAPANFSGMVVMDDTDPVTVMFTWDGLVGEDATGIPSNGDQSLNYTVSIDGTSTTVTTSMEMIEVTGLASCTEYSATLMASNKVNTGPSTTVDFTTIETVPPQPVVNSSDLVNCTIAPDTITLQCFWSNTSDYVTWYKDGVLISEEDLGSNTTLMSPSVGAVSSSFDDGMSILTIMNSNFNDSGNYTCVVSCGARGVEFDIISPTLLDTIHVLVFEPPSEPRNVNEELGYLQATISWTQPEFFGVPDPLSPDGLVWYVVQVTRDDTGEVIPESRVNHPTTSTVVDLNVPCENYTVTVRAENKAGPSMNVSRSFTLVESGAVNVSLDPMGPLEHNFTARDSNINITLNCTWYPRAYYLLWTVGNSSQYSRNVFAINLVTEVMDVTVPMDLPISVTYDADNRYSVLTITDAFISDSGNYTCSVTCEAEKVVNGVLERVPETRRETREVIVQAVPENLTPLNRQSSYIVLQWTAPPPPFTGNYLLTYSYMNGTIIDSIPVSDTTHNITNLPSFTRFLVEVRANNGPVRGFGPAVIGSFSTLPRIVLLPGETPSLVTVVEKGDGTQEVVPINIPNVVFADSPEALSHIWVVCIRNRDDNLGNPDRDFPNNDTFGFYGNAGNGVPYIVSEFSVDDYPLPRDFQVGDPSQANDFPDTYVNGPIDGNDVLDCFIRYFITLDDPPSGNNRRRRAVGVRQYDLFVSSGYIQVSEPFSRRSLLAGLVATGVIILILGIIGIVIVAIIVIFFLCRRCGYWKENEYIASQGPLTTTEDDFWRMVWEQNSRLIIMLTKTVENGKVKCSKYWPEDGQASYNDIRVIPSSVQKSADIVTRTFQMIRGDEARKLTHVHYVSWPDYGAPKEVFSILRLAKRMDKLIDVDTGPTIVHCSTGVGRTGTLIAIRSLMQMVDDKEKLSVFNFILQMRKRRSYMVQSQREYVFIHDAMVEYIKSRSHLVESSDLKSLVDFLSSVDPRTGKTGFEKEYKELESIEVVDDKQREFGLEIEHYLRNRFPENIPYDRYRIELPLIPHSEGSDYYPAVYIDGFHKTNQYILAEGPMDATLLEFWRMVWTTKASCIVMFGPTTDNGQDICAQYWPSAEDGSGHIGAYTVQIEQEVVKPSGLAIRDVTMKNMKDEEEHKMKLYHYPGWPTGGLPQGKKHVLEIVDSLSKSQERYGGGPIILHDSGSTGASATFCALTTIIDYLKLEGAVDVFSIVRAVRSRQPRAVDRLELYQYLYTGPLGMLVASSMEE